MIHDSARAVNTCVPKSDPHWQDDRAKLLTAMQRAINILHPNERLTVRWHELTTDMPEPPPVSQGGAA